MTAPAALTLDGPGSEPLPVPGESERHPGADRSPAVAATAGVAAAALLVGGVALVSGLTRSEPWGRFLARLDVAVPVLFVLAGFALYRPFAQAHLAGAPSPPSRRHLRRVVSRIYPAWWVALAGSIVVLEPPVGARTLVAQALLFRSPGLAGPPEGLTIGWVLAVVVAFAVVLPVYASLVRRGGGASPDRRLRRELFGAGLLVLVATAYRLACLALGADEPFGALSHLPGHLDQLALGMAMAAATVPSAAVTRIGAGARGAASRWGWRLPAASLGLAGLAFLAAATVAGLPRGPIPTSDGQVLGRHALYSVVAVCAVVPAALAQSRPHRHPVFDARPMRWLGAVALGLLLWHEPITDLVVRQYPERLLEVTGESFYAGPALPVLLWVVLVTVAVAICSCALVERPTTHLAGFGSPSWSPKGFPLWLATVVAGGFTWRVVALLTIAPERTDGGDPLFYHSQANLLANGRGFLEPLNWIAYGRSIPSALHGPAYSVYLSFFSRLGGTTYFDHKMASCLAGAGIVLVAALIARRLAGDRAAIVAGVLAAAYPNLWIIDGVLFTEGLFVLLTGMAVLFAYRWRDTRRWIDAGVLGVLIGLAALTRGEGLFLLGLLVLPWVLLTKGLERRRKVLALAACGAGAVLALAPWMVRNATTFETFVPLSTNGDELHVYSNCDETYSGKFLGFWLFDCQERIRREQGEPPGDEAEKARYWRDVGFDYARDHAGELPKVVAARVGRVWELFRPLQNAEFAAIEGRDVAVTKIGLAMYYALVPLAAFGVVRLWRRRVPMLPLLVQFLSVTITAAYAYGTIRFRAPAELSLCVLGAVGLLPVVDRVGAALRPSPVPQPLASSDAFVLGGTGGWRRWRTWASVAAVLAVALAPVRGLWRNPGAPMEEGFMLTFPERVLRGDVPNVDFLHLYGPGSLHVLAGVYEVLGVRLEVERLFGMAQHLGVVLAIWAIARAWGRLAAALCAVLSVFLVVNPIGLSALAWTGGVALGLWSVVLGLRATAPATVRRTPWFVAAGVLAGLALTYRPDLVIALALAHGFLLWRHRRPALTLALPGLVVGLAPMWVHLVVAGIGPAFEGMVLDPVRNLRPGRELPRPPSWDRLDGALQVIAEKFPPWWGLPHPAASQQLFLWFFLLPVVALGVAGVGWWSHRRASAGGDRMAVARTRALLAAGLFGAGLLPQALQRPDSAHFSWVGCVAIPLLPVAIVELVAHWRPTWSRPSRVVAGGAVVVGLYLAVIPFFTLRDYLLHVRQALGQVPPGLLVERDDRRFYLGDLPPWNATRALVADLDRLAQPGERLFVGPVDLRHTNYSDVVFYYLFPELTPATSFIEMDPGLANGDDAPLADDVASADWLVLTRFWAGWIEPNESRRFGPDLPNQVVEDQFCLVGSYENDLARLYRRCEGGGAPGPYEGPYDPAHDPAVEVNVQVPKRPDGSGPPVRYTGYPD